MALNPYGRGGILLVNDPAFENAYNVLSMKTSQWINLTTNRMSQILTGGMLRDGVCFLPERSDRHFKATNDTTLIVEGMRWPKLEFSSYLYGEYPVNMFFVFHSAS
jgi:hypothetical protein